MISKAGTVYKFIAVWACLAIGSSVYSESNNAPVGMTIYSNGRGGVDVFWFYESMHISSLGNLQYSPFDGGFVSTQSEASILSRFKVKPPVFIDSIITIIENRDISGSLPGDQFTPLSASLRSTLSMNRDFLLWEGSLRLDSDCNLEYCRTSVPVREAISEENEIWQSFDWRNPYLTAPLIGRIHEYYALDQWYLIDTNGGFKAEECYEEYSAGLKLLGWTADSDNHKLDGDSPAMFEVRYSDDTLDFISNSAVAGVCDADSLYLSINVPHHSYLAVLVRDSAGGRHSDFLRYDSSKLAPISISPSIFDKVFIPDEINSYAIAVESRAIVDIEAEIYSSSPNVTISPDRIWLPAGGTGNLTVEFNAAAVSDTLFASYIIIGTDSSFYPLIYFMRFLQDKPLDAGDREPLIPQRFQVGQPYPNPFNSVLSIPVSTSSRKNLTVSLYNLLGQELLRRNLIVNGSQRVILDLDDSVEKPLSSAVYFLKISDDTQSQLRRVIFLK